MGRAGDWKEMLRSYVESRAVLHVSLEWVLHRRSKVGWAPYRGRNKRRLRANLFLTVEELAQGHHNESFYRMISALYSRGEHGVLQPPALVHVRIVAILIPNDKGETTELQVRSRGKTFRSDRLFAKVEPENKMVMDYLYSALLRHLGYKGYQRRMYNAVNRFLSELVLGQRLKPITTASRIPYDGSESLWLDEQLRRHMHAVRAAEPSEVWQPIVELTGLLYRMLEEYRLPRGFNVMSALRPMLILPDSRQIKPVWQNMVKWSDQKYGYDRYALFMWSTETVTAQMVGNVVIAPQTRYVWCTRNAVCLLDIRVPDDDWLTRTLLPELHLVAIDMPVGLVYVCSMEQLPDGEHVRARYESFSFASGSYINNSMMIMMMLSNVRESVRRRLDECSTDNLCELVLAFPRWYKLGIKEERRLVLYRLTEPVRTVLDWRILPERFPQYLREVLHAFLTSAYQGVKFSCIHDLSKRYYINIDFPPLLGLLCGINLLDGEHRQSLRSLYQAWLLKSFRLLPNACAWHALAWRFLDIAVYAGLTQRYARYLYELEPGVCETMLMWRTVEAAKGAPIPCVAEPTAVQRERPHGYDASAVRPLPISHYGRRLEYSGEQLERLLDSFDPQYYTGCLSAYRALFDLLMKE